MKIKILLCLVSLSTILGAQEPNRSLVITEVRMDRIPNTHLEVTNMGTDPIDLSEFKFGQISPSAPPIYDLWNDPYITSTYFFLPGQVSKILQPGESYVITTAYDFGPKMYNKRVPGFEGNQRPKQPEFNNLADFLMHVKEDKSEFYPEVTDSITPGYRYDLVWQVGLGGRVFYIEHHFAEGDSAVVDQFNGVFNANGKNEWVEGYDIAGVKAGTATSLCVRKFSVKNGNPDFANARGVGREDSEWIVIPYPHEDHTDSWRDLWWTVGNHGDFILDENTLESDVIEVDFANKKLTVPWGIRRLDEIMRHMKKKPGIAWRYTLNELYEDSLYRSARTGDKLTVYVCGTEHQEATFDIVVKEPTADVNILVPVAHKNLEEGPVTGSTQNGILGWPRVTKHESGEDTITGNWFGVAYAMRTDTLMKYLEKPANATWEFVWVDSIERPDLKHGDKLKVIAENGDVKEYFIEVQPYAKSHNAYLSSITWPDIPEFYKGIYGWVGDTIPNFNATNFTYKIQVPFDVDGIPALVAKTHSLNATVEVTRATSLSGSSENRTIIFDVTAEDDSVKHSYKIELIKELDGQNIQPYFGEPFLSEWMTQSGGNRFGEICNPGNQPLDLSNYMLAFYDLTDHVAVIRADTKSTDDRRNILRKYVPGYKWVDASQWEVKPGYLEPDLNVNPIVQPGDVFVMGHIANDGLITTARNQVPGYRWPVVDQLDIQFNNYKGVESYQNPWGEPVNGQNTLMGLWQGCEFYIFKILNDSIKLGLKPANDPNDFELIEAFGNADGSTWNIGGRLIVPDNQISRKPEIYKGQPLLGGSFGTNPDDSEWVIKNRAYWQSQNVGWPWEILYMHYDFGQHFFIEPTFYKSTISSLVYKVSDGYKWDEQIRGIVSGTSVAEFLDNLIKADENQSVTIKSVGDGSILAVDALLTLNDTLVVLSADSTNITKYILDVSEAGLSSDALLSSTLYDIEIEKAPIEVGEVTENGIGSISGFEYGTQLRTIMRNVNLPAGASMDVINNKGAYVPLKVLNFDTAYVVVTVNSDIYFDVLAEDGITRIIYQLIPNSTENDAFILSDIYTVAQKENLVHFIPRGTNVQTFLSYLVPASGATLKLVDKSGNERADGTVKEDDKIVVISANKLVTRVYHLSMLRTEIIPETTYLAYVLSNTYNVNQLEYLISGPSGSTTLSEFYAQIIPVMGATAVVIDREGAEKTSGDLDEGDMLKVTSADGKIEVMYELDLDLTSIDDLATGKIQLYPNPTTGLVYISGLERGTRIQIFNQAGSIIRDLKASQGIETITIDNQASGMYLVIITNNAQLLGQYKLMRK